MKTPQPAFFILSFLVLALPLSSSAVTARLVSNPFTYNFNSAGILDETSSTDNSSSPYFSLNSGGRLIIADGVGKTIQGSLPLGDKWQKLYGLNNPLDTLGGLYPQNLFRLLTRSSWNNLTQEVKFKITKTNLTETPNRDGYSGILLMSRYQNSDNLYYAGLRQDGLAVIKKKLNGVYTTLGSTRVFPGTYNRLTTPNLIPENQWLAVKSEVRDLSNGSVEITLWVDTTSTGTWTQVLKVNDVTSPIKGSGLAGIRSDYMDLLFEDYKLTEVK